MSLLFSDSLLGVIDEKSFIDDVEAIGKIKFKSADKDIDAFIFDKRAIRVHAIATPKDAIELISQEEEVDAVISLGEKGLTLKGKIQQVGWEQTLNGGRLVLGVIIRDK